MSIDYFYKIVHLSVTILMVGLILNIWIRYIQIEKKANANANRNKNSNSLLYFALMLVLWEYNLFDTDYRYEVFTTIIIDGLFLVAVTYYNNGVLLNGKNTKNIVIKVVPVVSIVLVFISNILINNYPENMLIGYLGALVYTFFTFIVISVHLFWYYRLRGLTEIGLVSCLLFLGLYSTIILSIVYSEDQVMFAWTKIFYLISTFGLYLVFANLAFNFLQDIINRQYSKVFTGTLNEEYEVDHKKISSTTFDHNFKALIAEDKLEETVELLLVSSQNNVEQMTSILMLANRLTSINTAKLRDTINFDTYRIERNKIVDSLIKIIHSK